MTSDLKPRRKPAKKKVNIRFYAALALVVLVCYLFFMSRTSGSPALDALRSKSAASDITRFKTPTRPNEKNRPVEEETKELVKTIKEDAKKVVQDGFEKVKEVSREAKVIVDKGVEGVKERVQLPTQTPKVTTKTQAVKETMAHVGVTDAYHNGKDEKQAVEKIEVKTKGTVLNAAKDIPAPRTETDAYDAANALSVLLETYEVILFSKTYCPHSKKAKTVLGRYTFSPAPLIFELDVEEHGPSLQAALAKLTGRATVPNLMVKGQSLGGGDELMTLDRTDTFIMKIRTISEKIDVTKKKT